jgi:(2Fe-2S) ferredoxin
MNKLRTSADLEKIARSKSEKNNKPCISVATGTCGIARGADEVVAALKKEIKKHGLESEVDIKITGCHGFCQIEPYLTILPEEIFYVNVQPEDAEEIVSETVIGKKIIERLLFTDLETDKKIIREDDIPFYKRQSRNLLSKK